MSLTQRTLCWQTHLTCYRGNVPYSWTRNTDLYSMDDNSQPRADQTWTSYKDNRYSTTESHCSKQIPGRTPWSLQSRYLKTKPRFDDAMWITVILMIIKETLTVLNTHYASWRHYAGRTRIWKRYFWRKGKTVVPGEQLTHPRTRTNNKPNLHEILI